MPYIIKRLLKDLFETIRALIVLLGLMACVTLIFQYVVPLFRGPCDFPYLYNKRVTLVRFYERNDFLAWRDSILDWNDNTTHKQFIDWPGDKNHAIIILPKSEHIRQAAMYDFEKNQLGVFDDTCKHCYVMPITPLVRDTDLSANNYVEVMLNEKIDAGNYNIDICRISRAGNRKFPPITEFSNISEYIVEECEGMQVLMLENCVSGVFRREDEPRTASGRFIDKDFKDSIETELFYIADMEEFEGKQ